VPPFQKVCGNCHVANVIISLIGGVYCNAYRSKSMVQKLGLLCGSIVTNDEHVLLIIEGKWLATIMHMIEFKFLDLPCPKQVQFLISIHIYGKFRLLITSTLVGFQEDIQQFIPQAKISLKGEAFVAPLTIIPNDYVQLSVKHKLDFVESKLIINKNPFRH
jgi:hypothetical protein